MNVIENIIKESDYNTYGARKLNKLLEDKIDMGYILSEIEMEFMKNYERSILSEIPNPVSGMG